jgi:hypothetical protein
MPRPLPFVTEAQNIPDGSIVLIGSFSNGVSAQEDSRDYSFVYKMNISTSLCYDNS